MLEAGDQLGSLLTEETVPQDIMILFTKNRLDRRRNKLERMGMLNLG